jgi:hypothetical protein
LPQTKKTDLLDFQNKRYIGIFKSQREREIERACAREIASARARTSERVGARAREREKEK